MAFLKTKNEIIKDSILDCYSLVVTNISTGSSTMSKFSNEDLDMVSSHHFRVCSNRSKTKYLTTRVDGKDVGMHRLISKVTGRKLVDHINGDTLDNRRQNLRICTQSQNMQNVVTAKGYVKKGSSFRVNIIFNKERIYLGTYETENEARIAYLVGHRVLNREFKTRNGDF